MKRLTERIVSKGPPATSSFAACPTTTSPPGRKATAEGSRAAPVSGSHSTRGPLPSSTATRLLVVPRSMPMIRPTQSVSEGLVDVPKQRAEVRDLGEPAPELLERRATVVGPIAREELAPEGFE